MLIAVRAAGSVERGLVVVLGGFVVVDALGEITEAVVRAARRGRDGDHVSTVRQ